jgi:hypothetical protein
MVQSTQATPLRVLQSVRYQLAVSSANAECLDSTFMATDLIENKLMGCANEITELDCMKSSVHPAHHQRALCSEDAPSACVRFQTLMSNSTCHLNVKFCQVFGTVEGESIQKSVVAK